MKKVKLARESNLIQGHVLDVSRAPLLAALRRYDPQLYIKWNPKKRAGRGCWELRRKPEFKTVREGRFLETPKFGKVFFPGDVFEFDGYTLAVPKYHETNFENHVKDFEYLSYDMVKWVADHDLFKYGYKGKNAIQEAEYREAKYEEKIDEESYAEKMYGFKQMRTQISDFREYILAGGDPYRLLDFWK